MKKKRKEKHFIDKPEYLGGLSAMRTFIKKNLKYPDEALEKKIEGSVYCTYQVSYKGKVEKVKVISGLGYGCDEEAIRLIKLLKFTPPKAPRKMKIWFNKKLRIHFRLPKTKPSPKEKKINPPKYNVSVSYSTPPKKKTIYSYTITINSKSSKNQ